MYIGSIFVTKREMLFSIIIFLVIVAMGIYIVGAMVGKIEEKNEIYYKALKIDNNTESFNYAQDTNAGDALLHGVIKTVDTVSIPEVSGNYMFISRIHEKYTMHIRTVTTMVNGKAKIKTETYWTWDYAGKESYKSKEVSIFENNYEVEKFNLEKLVKNLEVNKDNFIKTSKYNALRSGYVYSSSHDRYYYKFIPKEIEGNLLVNFSNNTINPVDENTITIQHGSIEDKLESIRKSEKTKVIIMWTVIVTLSLLIIYIFVSGHHQWLER